MLHPLPSLLPGITHAAITLGTFLLPGCSHDAPLKQTPLRERLKETAVSPDLYADWLTSRKTGTGTECLSPGAQRPLTPKNIALAYNLVRSCMPEISSCLWAMHPYRISLMVSMDLVRGVLPAFRCYSQALMVDELQKVIMSGDFTIAHLMRQSALELARMAVEATLDYVASSNENIVQTSARFLVGRKQMEHRLRLDVPTLSDPHVRDLLQESDIFVRSFNGFSAFGLFSPFDFMRLISLLSELFTHIWVLSSLTFGGTPLHVIILSVTLSALPAMFSWVAGERKSWIYPISQVEARTSAKQEAMRRLAHSDVYRPEIMLFDLGPWILQTWSRARKVLLGLELRQSGYDAGLTSRLLSRVYLSETFSAFQNIPLLLVLHSTSTTVGTFTLYRTTLQGLFLTAEALVHTLKTTFQGVFLMGAFCAATTLRPRLQPETSRIVPYQHSAMGMGIDVRNLCFTYPGGTTPALKNVNLSIRPGETLAIVGYNGSGKSTLANILLRILDFDSGDLLLNGIDVRRLQPRDFHTHVSAVFQGFSRFNTTVKANVGVGYVPDMSSSEAVDAALELAGAGNLVRSLPDGVRTRLEGDGSDRSYEAFCGDGSPGKLHGLSGGEWQRIAISRAFMRARRPEVELLLFDEPTSSLDAHAQKHVFDTIEQIARPNGDRTKTVIFITHRLATARRADKIAMMEHGTIVEFGTHEELLGRKEGYAALYHASV
ncbi:P-loop containing nucleoside triphosphate hydrolase protein [Lentinus brumalis]|uniref:P-loop containing nucleoside triphosphate hydrolase protein n=1 Tax=Lentinus brumalis TaxID=2498619 RepID=A0A371DT52_9APHY|nr:P-loop containing nucleoside triphosphate hydrolase protein [Polyporus brumalis]